MDHEKLMQCMSRVELALSGVQSKEQQQLLELIPLITEGMVQCEIYGQQGEKGPVTVPVKGSGISFTYNPKIIFGPMVGQPEHTAHLNCPHCGKKVSVVLS